MAKQKDNIKNRQNKSKLSKLPQYDAAWQCVLCHERLEKGNYKPMYCKWGDTKPRQDRLIIIMCLDCIDDFDSDDHEEIMRSVVNGWEVEIQRSKGLSKEQKQAHKDTYHNLNIFSVSSRR